MSLIEFLKRRVASTRPAGTSQPVSTDYQQVEEGAAETASRELRYSWQDASMPARQRAIVDAQIKAYCEEMPVPVFAALGNLPPVIIPQQPLLTLAT